MNLPSFGGDGTVHEIPPTHRVLSLRGHAAVRANSFNPGDGEETDEEYVYVPDDPRAFWSDHPTYYRRFLEERVPKILWLDQLRAKLVEDLLNEVVFETGDERSPSHLKIPRWGISGVIVNNEKGGRVGKVRSHPTSEPHRQSGPREYLDLLVLANEFDRPAAIEALAGAGIDLPFDSASGWLNASVEPGLHGWLVATWSGVVAGLRLKPELARFHIESGELTVFAAELVKPVELLLRRVGQCPTRVQVENHPDDPECLFGIDLDFATGQTSPVRRRGLAVGR